MLVCASAHTSLESEVASYDCAHGYALRHRTNHRSSGRAHVLVHGHVEPLHGSEPRMHAVAVDPDAPPRVDASTGVAI